LCHEEPVEQADAHESRAANAREQADKAGGIGNKAMTALHAADATAAEAGLANARIAYLENRLLPHKKQPVAHHKATTKAKAKSKNTTARAGQQS
jgi:hypothetical protein